MSDWLLDEGGINGAIIEAQAKSKELCELLKRAEGGDIEASYLAQMVLYEAIVKAEAKKVVEGIEKEGHSLYDGRYIDGKTWQAIKKEVEDG